MPRGKLSRDGREDARLVKQLRQGDSEAFAALVRRHQDGVYHTVYRLVGDREEACDLTQEAFVRALEAIETFNPRMPFRAWVYRIGTNAAIDHLRRRGRAVEVSIEAIEQAGAAGGSGGVVLELRAPERDGPERLCDASETAELVHRALAELPYNYRAAIVLHHLEGMGYGEIANVLGVPRNTAKTWAHRGRGMLCESLEGVV